MVGTITSRIKAIIIISRNGQLSWTGIIMVEKHDSAMP